MSHDESNVATCPTVESPSVPAQTTKRQVLRIRTSKILDGHHERVAIVYVRQSSPHQVLEHRESRARQYALANHAVDLGWSKDRVVVIDEDQGQSGRSAEHRTGFQRLLAEVGMDHVGIVLGIELNRLARSSKDWHHLFELCAIFGTLLADEDGVYEANDPNDRLVLGLKGIMSEMELHTMRIRLDRGKLNKAERGELFSHAPIGYVRLPSGEMALDPDEQVQSVVRLIFDKFDELRTVQGVLRYLARQQIRIGVRPHSGVDRGELQWRRPGQTTLLNMLHHPIYAGAYRYGRRPKDRRRRVPGQVRAGRPAVPPDQYLVLLRDRCPAYITWDRHQENLRRLADNRMLAHGRGAPRGGMGLLPGLVVCGRCGHRMQVTYPDKLNRPRYCCRRQALNYAEPICQSVSGQGLDSFISQQILNVLEPAALELSLAAAADLEQERCRLDRHWQQRLERARYEAERAARQYRAVEPENRLVARELERRWEQALREQESLADDHDRFQREQLPSLSPQDRDVIRALASDIPALWQASSTTAEDRKTILRLLIERIVVTVQGETELMDVTVHWCGGFTSQHELARPVPVFEQMRDYDKLFARIKELHHSGWTAPEIAQQLNEEGWRRPRRLSPFNEYNVRHFLSRRGLANSRPRDPTLGQHLGEHEWWFADLARDVGMSTKTLYNWIGRGWVHARQLRGQQGRWILWADADERDRLRRLLQRARGSNNRAPAELTTPKVRPTTPA